MRDNATSAETKLWQQLRDRRLGGFKFVRQAPVDDYFADFLCRDRRLIVEVDGATHGSAEELKADAQRTEHLMLGGYKILRVGNDDVTSNLEGVLEAILDALEASVTE